MPVARRVFFSFHYERDVQRASVIRNSWVTKPNSEEAGFIDAANWEEVKKKGEPLRGHFKTGHTGSLQKRPTEGSRNLDVVLCRPLFGQV